VSWPGPDRSVVERTEQYKYEKCNERPTQIQTYRLHWRCLQSDVLVRLEPSTTRTAPEVLLIRTVQHRGPTRQQITDTSLWWLLSVRVWAEKLTEPTDERHIRPIRWWKWWWRAENRVYAPRLHVWCSRALLYSSGLSEIPIPDEYNKARLHQTCSRGRIDPVLCPSPPLSPSYWADMSAHPSVQSNFSAQPLPTIVITNDVSVICWRVGPSVLTVRMRRTSGAVRVVDGSNRTKTSLWRQRQCRR